ncbi:DUF4427 domain-containing protein [Paraburkholderia bannensis]|uniref:DUF4427 domain-containing protein n=1 Tax=Paraburkholderia bannensis TaxID=765414 RepID=UPI002ABE5E26|nr:DUF4427 domain-containing protein [Paraburkholderia bannensis]
MQNNNRFDLSEYLLHFFRDINQLSDNAIELPEDMGAHSIHEIDEDNPVVSAGFFLRAALQNGRLWATWSKRNAVRTVYGPRPAVCFTEMPIAALLEAGEARRDRGEAMSPFALAFPKKALHKEGARPVIYGLSSYATLPNGKGGGPRLLPESALPLNEQYRFVSQYYGREKTIDWTHEREWRWPYAGRPRKVKVVAGCELPPKKWSDIPGFDFYKACIMGIGVILETDEQAKQVISTMLTLVDRHVAIEKTFGFVLVRDRLPSITGLQDPAQLAEKIEGSKVNLKPYLSVPAAKTRRLHKRFTSLVQQVEDDAKNFKGHVWPTLGGCWLWLLDNTAELTRALVASGRVHVTTDGRYLASLDEFSEDRSRDERQEMAVRLAELVQETFNTPSCYFSVRDSDDPEVADNFTDAGPGDSEFFNCSWDYKRRQDS